MTGASNGSTPDLAGRPNLIRGKTQLLFGGMGRLSENSVANIKNKSHSVTATIEVPEGTTANGVIVAQGGAFGGWVLYAKDGRPAYCYNLFGLQQLQDLRRRAIPAGEHQIRMEFTYDGGGLAKGGAVTLYLDGKKVGEGRVDSTVADGLLGATRRPTSDPTPPRPSATTTASRTAASRSHHWVQIDLDDAAEDLDHLITPEERFRLAMARQ